MDNLCHTLTGAALAEAGLKHRTRFASAALMIAANLPDVDVLAFATGTPPVALRRGWTHGLLAQVAMDWLNNYGVRLLMPFSGQWFYGDAVFIVDPWLWLTLAGGVLLARRARRTRIAAIAVVLATVYIGAMVISARAARAYVMESWTARSGSPPLKL